MEEGVCRFCLNLVKNEFEVIDAVVGQMLEGLLMKVDLEASKNPILCPDCVEIVKKSYFFKTACMDTEEIILSFSITKDGAKFDMRDVYKNSRDVVGEDLDICRFCMNQIGSSSCVSINKLMKDVMYIDMFPIYMPKMDLNVIKDPVICTSCWENLESYFKFVQKCLDIEEKITKYRQNETTNSPDQMELSNVLHVLFKNTLTYPENCGQIPVIKQERLFEDVEQNAELKMHKEQIKCEEVLDIKEEDEDLREISCKSQVYKNETRHSDDASKVEKYRCGICNFKTSHIKQLKTHMLVHNITSDVKMYKCEICTYETKYKKHLKPHMLVHKDSSEVEMHKCGTCTYETKYKKSLQNHILIHKDTCEMHKCAICTYETKYKCYLKKHMLVHKAASEVETYKCGICTYETKYKRSLKNHVLIHKDACEMYECGICTYETKYKYDLKRHMVTHKDTTEIEMYKCEMCTYETKYKRSIKNHILIHKEVCEMHKCGICSYESKYKDYLKRHMLTHKETSEIEMHECGICTYTTKHKRCLKRHMLTHKETSEVEMHKCTICTYETKYSRCLKRHVLMHKDS